MPTIEATYKLEPTPGPPTSQQSHVSLVFSWGDALRAVALREGESLVVGRAEPAQIVIDDRSLSRTHARFSLAQGRLQLTDLVSTNGSHVNGLKVTEVLVGEGDEVRLGAVDVRISGRPRVQKDLGAVHSHAAFMERLEQELTRGRVFGRPTCVLAVRADGEEPRWFRSLRAVDAVCGYAPRVHLVMLAEADVEAGCAWAEAQRKASRELAIGIAGCPAHVASPEAIVELALEAARMAKPGAPVQVAELGRDRPNLAAPVVASENMRRLYELVARVARTTLPVLVLGETGSGKELVAQAVHARSPRNKGPFKALNCATIPANLLESVLFGHERGAFTGADKQAPGIFEQAQGGSVFLDEVGELSPQAQAAFLRVLETKRLVRVGGAKEIEVDVRVVAATHRDLSAMVAAGTFREDLMFRLDALSLRVPPLRERREEILPLAELFAARAAEQWGAGRKEISVDAREALEAYAWPGNVRQLKNAMERAVAVCGSEVIELEDLPEQLWAEPIPPAGGAAGEGAGTGAPAGDGKGRFRALPERVREFEVGLIREALEKAHGNQAQAARILGVPRRTLANKVHAYGLIY